MTKLKPAVTITFLSGIVFSVYFKLPYVIIPLLFLYFIIYETLLSDHIKYNVQKDQKINFKDCEEVNLTLKNTIIELPDKYTSGDYTLLLEVKLKSSCSGYIFDPYTIIGNPSDRQFFERGFNGIRYINISHSVDGSQLKLRFKNCRLKTDHVKLIAFKNIALNNKKVLVMSPHPDDAELSSFGVYSNFESMIVTVTAGESEADRLIPLTQASESASLLKGNLRSFDSTVIPIWAGVPRERCINLGYFDGTLESMKLDSAKAISKGSKVDDIRYFRNFNSIKLESDNNGHATWENLVQDCTEIVNQFKPDIIVTPHPIIDVHPDHRYTTLAIQEAVKKIKSEFEFLFYANHIKATDTWPFGPSHSLVSTPPTASDAFSFFSYKCTNDTQIKKACALEMMHDIRFDTSLKKAIRFYLQKIFINRVTPAFGAVNYYRRAIRKNEVFFQ